MSIQGSINSAISTIGSLKKLGELSEQQKKTSEELAKMNRYELTDEELEIMNKAQGLPDDDMAMDIVESVVGNDEINQIKLRLSDEEYKRYTDAIYKQIQKQHRDLNINGLSRTPGEMQQAQYYAYKNLANLKLGEVNNRARYASGTQQYDLSDEDWGVQG